MSKKKCLLVINRFAGNYKVGDEETIKKSIGDEYELTVLYVSDETDSVTRIEGYDLVVVSGGDGTLNRLINRDIATGTEVRYYPSGTLNEAADRRVRRGRVISAVGSADGRLFTYVLAAGTLEGFSRTCLRRARSLLSATSWTSGRSSVSKRSRTSQG